MNVTAEIIEEGSDGAQQRTSYDLRVRRSALPLNTHNKAGI